MPRPDEDVLYVNDEASFSVSREQHGSRRHFLDVLCGGVGMFERRLEMTAEEVESFRHDPTELITLADQVRKWPERFGQRVSVL